MDVKYAFIGIVGLAVLIAVSSTMGKHAEPLARDTLQRDIQKTLADQDTAQSALEPKGLAVPSAETAENPEMPANTTGTGVGAAAPSGPFPTIGQASGQPAAMQQNLPTGTSPRGSILPTIPPPQMGQPPTPKPFGSIGDAAAKNNPAPFALSDGRRITFSGEHVYTVGADGQLTALADGKYTLAGGQPLIVQGGKRQFTP